MPLLMRDDATWQGERGIGHYIEGVGGKKRTAKEIQWGLVLNYS